MHRQRKNACVNYKQLMERSPVMNDDVRLHCWLACETFRWDVTERAFKAMVSFMKLIVDGVAEHAALNKQDVC